MNSEELYLNEASNKQEMMLSAPVSLLTIKLAIPSIVIMMVSSFYNMADTYFVSFIGTSATAGVGVVYSLMGIIQATGYFFGHGSGNFISRSLGAKKIPEAEKMAATGFFSSFGIGIFFVVFGIIFIMPLARILGSTDTILPFSVDYLRYILLGAPFMVSSLMLNNILRYQGSSFFGMIGMVTGAIINIALDPIFIFIFGLGVKGASLATMLSQCISFFLLLFAACGKKGNLRISFKNFSPSVFHYREMVRGGLPSLLRQSLHSLTALLLNHAAGPYGDAVIAAISIVNRIITMANSAILGLGQSFQPICGFNYGAGRYDRVKKAFWFCLWLSTVLLIIVSILGYIFARPIIAQFRPDDAVVISVGTFMLRMNCLPLSLLGWTFLVGILLQTMGKALLASIHAFARQGLFFVLSFLIMVPTLGILGIQLCAPVAEILSFVMSLFMGISAFRKDLSATNPSSLSNPQSLSEVPL